MSNVVVPKNFGAPSKRFTEQPRVNDELGAGVSAGYSVIGYRGKVWSIKHSGNEIPLMRDDGDGPRGSIEVVIVKAAAAISKIFYANGYQDGANAAPDCWSADGVKPDASVQNKECTTCAACPRNAWGSRVTEAGKQGKQCADSRRIAVVPANDLENETFGGPMLLRVPAASLKDLKAYGETLNSYGYPYYEVSTRISFDAKEAFPKFVFSAIKPLEEADVLTIAELRTDKRVAQLLNEAVEQAAVAQPEQAQVPASPFEEPPSTKATVASSTASQPVAAASSAKPSVSSSKATAAGATKTATATKAATKPATVTAPSEPEEEDVTSEGNVPKSFDALLDDIL